MSWSRIKGQSLAVRLLRQAVKADKVAHAYLFVGPPGVGKGLTALELAKSLNCLSPDPEGGACDRCISCRKMEADPPVHPDLMIVAPDGRFIKTEQMKALQGEMYARPAEGRARIAIVDGAERLNQESGNRVLKLLEEPPPYAVLILLTSNLAGVLPTIQSRCQVVNFPPLTGDEVAAYLVEERKMTTGEASLFAALSGGSIGRAVEMASNPEVLEWRAQALDWLERLREMDDFDLLSAAEMLEKQRESLDARLDMLTLWIRDGLLLAQGAPEELVVNGDKLQEGRRLAAAYGPAGLAAMLESVADLRSALLRNANTRLALDVMMLRLQRAALSTAAG